MAVRMALSAPSFAQAARDYTDTTGGSLSAASLWRITQATGEKLAAHREAAATAASAPGQVDERVDAPRVAPHRPLSGIANLSTDGGMIHVREEGWKEVKISTLSAVSSRFDAKRDKEVVHLSQHSYTAWLGSADEFAPYQYAPRGCGADSTRWSS